MTTDIRRTFFADVKWLGAVQIALRAKSLVILPFLTRDLGTADFGVWSQVAIVTALAAPFISWGTASGFVRHKAGTSVAERAGLFRAWNYALLAAFAVVFAVTLATAPILQLLLGSPADGRTLIMLAVLFAISGALLNAQIVWLQVNGESRIHALALLFQAFTSLAATATFLLVGSGVVFLVSLMLTADFLIVTVLFARHLSRQGWGRADFPAFWKAFCYGLPLMPMAFANVGINWIDRVVLLRYLPISDIGIYNLVHGLALMMVQTVTQPLRAYYPPRATALYNAGKIDELRVLHGISAGTLFAIQVPASIGLFFVAPAFLSIMAPPAFASGAQVLPLLYLGYAIDRQTNYGLQVFEWQYRQHWVTITHFGCFALNLLLNLALVPRMGIVGAGVANVIAFASRFAFVNAMVRDGSPVSSSPMFIAKILVAGLAMAALLWLLAGGDGAEADLWRAAVRIAELTVAGAVAYLVALTLLGVLPVTRLRAVLLGVRQA